MRRLRALIVAISLIGAAPCYGQQGDISLAGGTSEEVIIEVTRQLKEGLDDMGHVTLYIPISDDLSAGIVCFDVGGMSSEAVVDHLRGQDIVATTTPYAVSYPRLTPSIYNTPGDVDQALGAIESLA